MKVKIGIACDDIGFERKEEVRHYLEEVKGMEVVYDPVKVPADGQNTFAVLADDMATRIQKDEFRLGMSAGELIKTHAPGVEAFSAKVKPYLLY